MNQVWNDCPLCHQKMVYDDMNFMISCSSCDSYDVYLGFGNSSIIEYDVITIGDYEIVRKPSQTKITESFNSRTAVFIDYVIPIHKIINTKYIKKLLVMI